MHLVKTTAFSIIGTVALYLGLTSYLLAAPKDIDHLIPVTGEDLSPPLQRLLEKKLFLSSASVGRIVVMPSGIHGEYSIAIDTASSTGATITYTETATNIGARVAADLAQGISPKDQRRVSVRRVDVPIDSSIAVGISSVLRQSVRTAHPLSQSGWVATDVVVDGTGYWFLANGHRTATMQGLLGPIMKGRYTDGLRRLTQHLIDYCVAKADRRPKISTKIRSDIAALSRFNEV